MQYLKNPKEKQGYTLTTRKNKIILAIDWKKEGKINEIANSFG